MGTQTPTRPKKNKKQRPDAATARRLTIIKARNKRISLIAVGLCYIGRHYHRCAFFTAAGTREG